ncbi:MAG: hypothetical protein ACYSWP_12880 [Planctomycetota bacterium]|jgi:hypothetical protein
MNRTMDDVKGLQDSCISDAEQTLMNLGQVYGQPTTLEDNIRLIGIGLIQIAKSISTLSITLLAIREDERKI